MYHGAMKILVTGAAGFIGFHLCQRLLERGDEIVGFDTINAYYEPTLKEARLAILKEHPKFSFKKGDILDRKAVADAMKGVDRVVHLAALAGVRYAYDHPEEYVDTNIKGFFNVIDEVRLQKIDGLIYASTSSVYGGNTKFPSSEEDMAITAIAMSLARRSGRKRKSRFESRKFATIAGP